MDNTLASNNILDGSSSSSTMGALWANIQKLQYNCASKLEAVDAVGVIDTFAYDVAVHLEQEASIILPSADAHATDAVAVPAAAASVPARPEASIPILTPPTLSVQEHTHSHHCNEILAGIQIDLALQRLPEDIFNDHLDYTYVGRQTELFPRYCYGALIMQMQEHWRPSAPVCRHAAGG
jgi:hypothetical protein